MTVEDFLAKAKKAVLAARLLLNADDADGACNRAYYAMFDAARAALIVVRSPVAAEAARTHSGLLSAYSLHLVKPELVSRESGRRLNVAQEARLVADYAGGSISIQRAQTIVESAEMFVDEILALARNLPGP